MATTPVSLEQFGQTIKAKHPEYADMPDAAVASKVLAKFPQYHDMVDISANPKGEGVYQMRARDGKQVGIPYSSVTAAEGQGHFFTNRQEMDRFEKDNAADRSANDPHLQALTPSGGGIVQGALSEAGNIIKGGAAMFGAPQNAGEGALGPALPAYRMAKGYAQSAVTGLKQAAQYATSGQPVRAVATAAGAVNPLSSGPTASINARVDQGAPISNVIGQGVTDAALLAAPEAARAAGPTVSRIAQNTAEGLYRNALKPSTTAPAATNAARVRVGLDEGLPVSAAGYEKLGNLIDDYNQKIAGEIAKDPARPISPQSSLNNLRSVRDRFQNQVTPGADVDAINAKGNEFVSQFQPGGRFPQGTVPAADAQAIKQGTYSVLRGKFGEQGSAAVESEKALARGYKEEIATQFPEINNLNAAESRLLDLGPVLERAVNRVSNNHTIGIGGPIFGTAVRATTGSTGVAAVAGALKSIVDIPAVKSNLAIAISKGAKIPYPQALARVSAYSAQLGSTSPDSQGYSSGDSSIQGSGSAPRQ